MINKSILIIEPSTSGYALIKSAKTLGCFVMVMSADTDERVIPADFKKDIDQFIQVDTNCLDAILSKTQALQKKPDAVIPGFEIYVDIAAMIAKHFELLHVDTSAVKALRNKWVMRNKLKDASVRVPQYWKICSERDIDQYSHDFCFPLVIKPIDQSGSVHVSKVNSLEALKTAYQNMCAETWTEMAKGVGTHAIVETYISGKEYSVEGYLNQDVVVVSITEKTTTKPPYFVEMRHIVSANLSEQAAKTIEDYVRRVVKALKINCGVFHAEIKVDEVGPVLIEIAGRLAGDRICDLIQLAKGVDLRDMMIYSHLGMPILQSESLSQQYAGIQYFSIDHNNYKQVDGLDVLEALPGFYDFQRYYQKGQLVPALNSFLGRVAACVFTAKDYETLVARLDDATKVLRFA